MATDDYSAAQVERLAKRMPLGALPTPAQIADAVVYLARAEAVRRGFIACRLFPTRSSPPPPSGTVMDEIEPNPRGITRSEVEQAVAEWCQAHMDAPLCKKLERDR